MTTTTRRALAALAFLPLALAGCSTSGGTTAATTTATTSSAAQKLYDLCDKAGDIDKSAFFAAKNDSPDKTAHLEGSIETGAGSGSSTGTGGTTTTSTATSGSGTASPAPSASGSTGTSSGMPLAGDIDGRDQNNPKVHLTLGGSGGGGQMDMILVDKTVYLNMGSLSGNKYIQITSDQLAKQAGVDLNQMTNPNQQIDKAKDAVTKVTCVGREDVSGKQAAHIRMTIDTAKAAALATATGTATGSASGGTTSSGATPPSSTATTPKATSSMPATVDTDLWIDPDNRPMKVASGSGQQTVTMTYSKWGEPVTIQAPPTASVTQLPGFGGASGGSGASSSATAPASPSS